MDFKTGIKLEFSSIVREREREGGKRNIKYGRPIAEARNAEDGRYGDGKTC